MRFADSFLDEIRARLPVSEVVGKRVKLRKQGREWRGLSPFQTEKTPSFFVNDQKGFYHDFSSSKHGDIFTFLMETEGLSFPEAVERLASEAGLSLPKTTREMEERERRRKTLYEVVDLAATFFRLQLSLQGGARARAYLESRGISAQTQNEFQIGYAPGDRSALKQYLGGKGVPISDMIEAGLLISGDDIPVPYDRFRDRIIFPIHDSRGRVVAFGGRALAAEAQPKYLNSPETSLFHKGSVVFNFHRARQAAHDDGSVVVVEGYLDAISIYQAGLKSVVATMGTSFTEPQIETLWRLSDEPIVCFDGDKAGIGAAHRSLDRILPLLRVGRTFQFAFIHGDKDPDEVVRKHGLEALLGMLRGALPLWEVLWARETSESQPTTPDARAVLENKLYSIIRTIRDPTVNRAYHNTCRVELSNFFWEASKTARDAKRHIKDGLARRELVSPRENELQRVLLGMLVHYPEFIDDRSSDRIASVHFEDRLEQFRAALYDLLISFAHLDVALIYTQLGEAYYDVLRDVHGERPDGSQRGHRLFARFPILKLDPPKDFVERCIDLFVRILHVRQMAAELEQMVQDVRPDGSNLQISSERIGQLVHDIEAQKGLIEGIDRDLADEASEIRRLGFGNAKWQRYAA